MKTYNDGLKKAGVMEKIAELTPEKFLDELDLYNEDMPYHNVGNYEISELWNEDQVKWMLNKYYELKSNFTAELDIRTFDDCPKCGEREVVNFNDHVCAGLFNE